MNKQIPIFLASDDNYAPFLCTTIYSILENTKSYIEFIVLDGGITESSKSLIENSLSCFKNYSVEYVDMSEYGLERFPSLKHYSLNTFSRYFIPEIKPDASKIIYLDVDIIVKGDIADFYNQDLENYPIGAVLEDFYGLNAITLKEKIWPQFSSGKKYFNAGVLLMDDQKIIENDYAKKCIDLTVELFDILSCPDQDIFNIIFENNFKVLDYVYNFMPDHYELLEKLHPRRAKEIRNNVVTIHYTAGKPWFNASCMSKDFWQIAEKTLFHKQLLKKLKAYEKNLVKAYFLGFIPLLKPKFFAKVSKFEFDKLPLFKKKTKGNKTVVYFCAIPILKIKY